MSADVKPVPQITVHSKNCRENAWPFFCACPFEIGWYERTNEAVGIDAELRLRVLIQDNGKGKPDSVIWHLWNFDKDGKTINDTIGRAHSLNCAAEAALDIMEYQEMEQKT